MLATTHPPPRVLGGRYTLERKIGEGRHTAVFRVVDTRLSVARAVKILLPDEAVGPGVRARFESQARRVAGLDHPHLVHVYDVVGVGRLLFAVVELVPGGHLGRWLAEHGPLPARRACTCVREVAVGVSAAHGWKLVHGDIRPDNVLVTAGGRCKLADLGLSRLRPEARPTRPGFLAPDVAKGQADVRADVFGLGMTLYVLLTNGDPVTRLAGRGLDGVPEPLRDVIARATALDRNRRQPDVRTFLEELEAGLAHLPPDPLAPALAVPSDGEELDWNEVSTLTGGTRREKTTPPSGGTSRTAPARASTTGTPDWVDRSSRAGPVRGFSVELDQASREETKRAREARFAQAGTGSMANDAATFGLQIGASLMGNVRDPRRVTGPVVALLLLFLGLPTVKAARFQFDAWKAAEAQEEFVALVEGGVGHATVVALGADARILDALRKDWERADGATRAAAMERYVEALENELRLRGMPGERETEAARAELAKLRAAVDAVERFEIVSTASPAALSAP